MELADRNPPEVVCIVVEWGVGCKLVIKLAREAFPVNVSVSDGNSEFMVCR